MDKCIIFGSGSAGLRHARNAITLGFEVAIITQREVEGFTCYKSFEESNNLFNPDFGIIANRTSEHLDALNALVEGNLPALIEKPLTTTINEPLETIIESIDSQSSPECYRVAYLMRYHPLVTQLQADLPTLGKINYINSQYGHFLPWWRKDSNLKKSYSAFSNQGGGVMYDSSHEIDLIQFLFGKVISVSAKIRNFKSLDIDSDELCSLSLELEDNIIADVSLDYLSKIPIRSFRVEGTNGTVILDFVNDSYFISTSNTKEIRKIKMKIDRNSIFITELKDFTKNMKECILPNIVESLETLSIFDLAHKSNG